MDRSATGGSDAEAGSPHGRSTDTVQAKAPWADAARADAAQVDAARVEELSADALREDVVAAALARLDVDAKAALLAGQDMWSLAAIPEIGLAPVVTSDGPAGVRGGRWTPDDPSVALPAPTALAATWDTGLVRRVGRLMAQEARRKGVHVVLAPTVNLHRTPRGGRHFECYSEDPRLTGSIGAAFTAGVQDGGVAATPKHFTANDSETERLTLDVRVSEAALRQAYLAPFEQIVREARPWCLMAAYNGVNGTTMTQNRQLNEDVLRVEWGFDGVLVSDWTAARDTVGCALGGLDVAMPGPVTVYGEALAEAVRDGRVPETVLDEHVRRVLRLAARVGCLAGAPPASAKAELDASIDGEALVREVAARSFVLLHNTGGVLPLNVRRTDDEPFSDAASASGRATAGLDEVAPVRRVALIGGAAVEPRYGGGGSAQVFPTRLVNLRDALAAALPAGVELRHEQGADPRTAPAPAGAGFRLRAELRGADGGVLAAEPLAGGWVRWMGELPGQVALADVEAVEVTGAFRPDVAGAHQFALRGCGDFRLEIGGEVLVDEHFPPDPADPSAGFLMPVERTLTLELPADAEVPVRLRHRPIKERGLAEVFDLITFRFGHRAPGRDDADLIADAVAAAREADVAVVVVATTEEVETEGLDRPSLALPGRQDELVHRVAAANPRTVVVVNAGAPVLMPWRDEVAAVLLAWFPGQEGGPALADVLLGTAEPGGRLPTTWPGAEEDCPVWEVEPQDGRLEYAEGVEVGYRGWLLHRGRPAPAYWFGHGIGYTDWSYEAVAVRPAADGAAAAEVDVRVRNSGPRAGRETVQVYVEPAEQPHARRLAAFAVVEAGPGETAEVRLRVPWEAVREWDTAAAAWRMPRGTHRVRVGRGVGDPGLTAEMDVAPRR